MTKIMKTALASLVIVLIFAVNGFALDRYYLLRKGNIARDEGRIEAAIRYYQEYIESHPTTMGVHSAQYHRRIQYYIRNLLLGYSNLLDTYRENGKREPINKWINKLKDAYFSSNFGSKNMYNLGRIYLDNNLVGDATDLFERIIREHKETKNAFNNKVALRAYSKLLKIYESQGKNEKVVQLLELSRSSYPTPHFDLRDKYRLAVLYLNYGLETNGEALLNEIIYNEELDPDSSDSNTIIKTCSKLLKIFHKRKDTDSRDKLVEQISRRYVVERLSPNNMYILAVTYLKCGKREEGSKLLREIADQYSYTTFARKSLFLLGRLSQSIEDWDSAIKYYAEYVERYPDPPFFALKAYSRLIDSYWSRDANIELAQDEIKKLTDIVNEISDFETQLNLARDLTWKGMDELSSATFSLGLSFARKFISKNEGTYQALRTYWIIEKYAYALDKPDLVKKCGNAILGIANNLRNAPMKPDEVEKIDYINCQTYLWLAKVHRDNKDYREATKCLKMVIERYPKQKEIDYARYELGRVYEETKQVEEAIDVYKMVQDSMWKKQAQKRLSTLGF